MSEHDSTAHLFPLVGDVTLAQALSDSFYMDFISKTLGDYLEHNPRCRACAFKNRCGGGCRGRAVGANGGSDLLGVDPDACLVFKGGYYERVKKLIEAAPPAATSADQPAAQPAAASANQPAAQPAAASANQPATASAAASATQ